MEIYLSVGVSTLVALMATHRTGAGRDWTVPAIFDTGEIDLVSADPHAGSAPAVVRCEVRWPEPAIEN